MKNILKFEFHKILRQKSFYVCLILMLLTSYMSLKITKSYSTGDAFSEGILSGRLALLEALCTSNFTMLAGLFVTLYCITDFSEQTVKNIFARGFARGKVYFSKYIVALCATLIMFVVTMLFSLIVGSIMFKGSFNEKIGLNILGQFIYVIAITSFVFMTSYSIKRTGPSIAVALIGITIIGTALSVIDAYANIDNFYFADLWLSSFSNDLIETTITNKRAGTIIGLSCGYSVIFTLIGYFVARNQED